MNLMSGTGWFWADIFMRSMSQIIWEIIIHMSPKRLLGWVDKGLIDSDRLTPWIGIDHSTWLQLRAEGCWTSLPIHFWFYQDSDRNEAKLILAGPKSNMKPWANIYHLTFLLFLVVHTPLPATRESHSWGVSHVFYSLHQLAATPPRPSWAATEIEHQTRT